MKNETLAHARRILQQRRLAEDIALEQRLDEIGEKLPAVMQVRARLATTAVQLSRLILAHKEDVAQGVERIRRSNLALQEEEKRLLREGGYPEDYLEHRYQCARCKDTGYLGDERCQCLKNLMRQLALEELNRVSQLKLSSFSDFELRYYPAAPDPGTKIVPQDWMGQVLGFCQNYAEQFSPASKSILMQGPTGLGKTHLSLAIAAKVIEQGYGVVYGSAQDFLRVVENEHFQRAEGKSRSETLDGLLEADLLILDDLGTEFSTSFTQSVIYNLINTRLIREKPTIISTNFTARELESKYEQRVMSRLHTQYVHLRFVGQDIRQLRSINRRAAPDA